MASSWPLDSYSCGHEQYNCDLGGNELENNQIAAQMGIASRTWDNSAVFVKLQSIQGDPIAIYHNHA